MLIITPHALAAIRTLLAPDGGVRIALAEARSDGAGPGLTVEPASAPELDDEIIASDGLELYIEGDAFALLDDKVLDADDEGDAIRFSVHD